MLVPQLASVYHFPLPSLSSIFTLAFFHCKHHTFPGILNFLVLCLSYNRLFTRTLLSLQTSAIQESFSHISHNSHTGDGLSIPLCVGPMPHRCFCSCGSFASIPCNLNLPAPTSTVFLAAPLILQSFGTWISLFLSTRCHHPECHYPPKTLTSTFITFTSLYLSHSPRFLPLGLVIPSSASEV